MNPMVSLSGPAFAGAPPAKDSAAAPAAEDLRNVRRVVMAALRWEGKRVNADDADSSADGRGSNAGRDFIGDYSLSVFVSGEGMMRAVSYTLRRNWGFGPKFRTSPTSILVAF